MHSPLFPAHVFPLHWEKMVGQLFLFSVASSFLFSFIFLYYTSFPSLSLSLSLPLSLYQLQTFSAIFTRQLFIYVSEQLDFISFFLFSLCSSLETYRAEPHAMQNGSRTVTHKLLQVWVALLSLCQNWAVHFTTFTRVWSNRSNILKH